jgi:hypothetical protein
MIRKKTTIILGAGSSAEYGFPVGSDLLAKIKAGVRYRFSHYSGKIEGDTDLLETLRRLYPPDAVNAYTTAGNKLAEVISSFISIDEALHWYANDPALVEIGKLSIAHYILSAEAKSGIGKIDPQNGNPTIDSAENTWISHFLSIAMSAGQHEAAADIFKNVTVVNFNYDRSVEHYLYIALQQKAGLTEPDARSAISNLSIVRPYGSLGKLNWQDAARGIPYGSVPTGRAKLDEIAKAIRTYTEQHKADIEEEVATALGEARLLLFFGFGYHPQNMKLLKTNKISQKPATVLGTVLAIDPLNLATIRTAIQSSLGGPLASTDVQLLDRRCADLIIGLRPMISALVS